MVDGAMVADTQQFRIAQFRIFEIALYHIS